MNISRFYEHWKIVENPFAGEEARHDPVFARIGGAQGSGASPTAGAANARPITHPDFQKILGDLSRPSSSIVFGEKGSGKTAIRLQIAARIDEHNRANPDAKVLLIPYDDLNPMLDRLCAAFKTGLDDEPPEVLKALEKLRLVDHLDSILHNAVPKVVDALLDEQRGTSAVTLPDKPWKILRRSEPTLRRDLLILQSLYDRQPGASERTRIVRRRLRLPGNRAAFVWRMLALFGWILPLGVLAADVSQKFWEWPRQFGPLVYLGSMYATLGLWLVFLIKWFIVDRWGIRHAARRLRKQLRTLPWTTETLSRTLWLLPWRVRDPAVLPTDDQEEKRYAMLGRLRRVLVPLGYRGLIIVLDRLDEPTIIAGDAVRMKAVVWPLLNNKFLQQEGIGVKLLLPIELRHELFRESAAFFQEARLDKQNLVEKLNWSGPMLYDLCSTRLNACREAGAAPIALTDLFEEDVARQDIIDALEQMHQPRDAFKLLYQCMHEHAAIVPDEQARYRIPRSVLDMVRRQQAERVSMLSRGIRPA
ncbi:MAG TPA: hypothetical protein VG797_09425 [Phycisphaerales bacterium]|nr:hypothetical protein [Phycisphaerales bacterium]